MVKLNDIPEEAPRIDLAELPPKNTLTYVSEKFVEAAPNKTGGLVIYWQDKDGNLIPQKYGKIAGAALKAALMKLHVKDTAELKGRWFEVELKNFRTGFPRYIPVAEVPVKLRAK